MESESLIFTGLEIPRDYRVTIGGKSLQHWFLENTVEQDWLSVMEEYNAFQAFISNKK